jgi:hypothetical protein
MKRNRNQHKRTPIPGLALYITAFNDKRDIKQELAALRAAVADRVYAASEPNMKRKK